MNDIREIFKGFDLLLFWNNYLRKLDLLDLSDKCEEIVLFLVKIEEKVFVGRSQAFKYLEDPYSLRKALIDLPEGGALEFFTDLISKKKTNYELFRRVKDLGCACALTINALEGRLYEQKN